MADGRCWRGADEASLSAVRVKLEHVGAVAMCTIVWPLAPDAATSTVYSECRRAIDLVNAEPDLVGMVITGSGKVFMQDRDRLEAGSAGKDFAAPLHGAAADCIRALRYSPKPVVVAVNGLCQGRGLHLALCASHAIASERAMFRMPELSRSLGGSRFNRVLTRLTTPRRMRDLLFTGGTLTARDALERGVISGVTRHDLLLSEARTMVDRCDRMVPAATKKSSTMGVARPG